MIYINNTNIFMRCNTTGTISHVSNNTGYFPLRVYDNILLMSDGKLYTIICNNELSILKIDSESDDYMVDSTDFTDKFVKINSKYYIICSSLLLLYAIPVPVIANNSHNIKRLFHNNLKYYRCYYYVNIDNKLVFFGAPNILNQYIILDDDVSSILYLHTDGMYIIYVKNDTIIYSGINDFTQLIDSYVIDYIGQSIIKSTDMFFLDSHNNLYELIIVNGSKCVIKKILSDIVDFYCSKFYICIIDTEGKIHHINKNNYSKLYIGVGHFGKSLRNIKSANNIYNKT